MSWKNKYLERAQSLSFMNMRDGGYTRLWNELEDDILGKLSLTQARELYEFAVDVPCQGSMVIMAMLPPGVDGIE
jgi:hypothetical protein